MCSSGARPRRPGCRSRALPPPVIAHGSFQSRPLRLVAVDSGRGHRSRLLDLGVARPSSTTSPRTATPTRSRFWSGAGWGTRSATATETQGHGLDASPAGSPPLLHRAGVNESRVSGMTCSPEATTDDQLDASSAINNGGPATAPPDDGACSAPHRRGRAAPPPTGPVFPEGLEGSGTGPWRWIHTYDGRRTRS